jgi:hypothetical protein
MMPKYAKEVQKLLARPDDENNHDQEPETEIPATPSNEPIKDIYILIVREEDEGDVIDSVAADLDTAPLRTKPAPQPAATGETGIVFFGVFVILLCLFCTAFQFYLLLNPFTATVTLVAKSQQLTLQGSLQLGRVLNPITLSQSQTARATGHGHQDARAATGELTFYNGQFQSVFVPAGTVLTGADGVQAITDADATIPAGNPPTYGQATVSAHAGNAGSSGNMAAFDINQTCCAASVLVKNTAPFQGGQDERDFQTVTRNDISQTAAPLKTNLAESVQGALQGQLKRGEQLQTLPCSTIVTSDHQPGQEATAVTVTASETCSALAYNGQELTDKVTQLLNRQAIKQLGAGYSLLEPPQITVTGAISARQATLSSRAVSRWAYAISSGEERHIKAVIAGKNTQEATRLLLSLPGTLSAAIQWSGFGDAARLPKNTRYIRISIVVM